MGAIRLHHASVAAQHTVALAEVREGAFGVNWTQLPSLFLGGLGQGVGAVRWVAVELAQALGAVVEAAGGAVVLGGSAFGAELTGRRARTHGRGQGARG